MSNTADNDVRKEQVLHIAFYEGLKWGVLTTGVSKF